MNILTLNKVDYYQLIFQVKKFYKENFKMNKMILQKLFKEIFLAY